MNGLDLRTIFFNYLLTNLVCLIVMFFLWYQSRNRFKGIGYLVLDALFQCLCTGLIFLRGNIPDFLPGVHGWRHSSLRCHEPFRCQAARWG